jgi:hypothetical protein
MGLDQHAFATKHEIAATDGEEIAYWRKHNRLQGWMDALWHAKGNVTSPEDKAGWGTSFNGQPLILTLDDLKALEDAIHDQTLPATQGFFFGSDSYRDMDAEGHYSYYHDDLKFIAAARAYIANGYTVYYVCSW